MPPPESGGIPPLTSSVRRWYALGQFAEGLKNESFGVGSQIAGFVVEAVGLQPKQAPETVGPEVVQGLGYTLGLSILLLCGVSLAFFSRYRLSRKRHAEIQQALDAGGVAARSGA